MKTLYKACPKIKNVIYREYSPQSSGGPGESPKQTALRVIALTKEKFQKVNFAFVDDFLAMYNTESHGESDRYLYDLNECLDAVKDAISNVENHDQDGEITISTIIRFLDLNAADPSRIIQSIGETFMCFQYGKTIEPYYSAEAFVQMLASSAAIDQTMS